MAGFLQFEIAVGEPEVNFQKVCHLVEQLEPGEDSLLVLPELWPTGFTYDAAVELAAGTPEMISRMAELARKHTIFLAGSMLELPSGGRAEKPPYNTLFLIGPEGVYGTCQKRHLFSLWDEDQHFSPGIPSYPLETPFGLVGGLVCYDLRFPDIARQHAFHGAGLVVVSAQWPEKRLDHWKILLRARAIENQVFVVAANGSGKTGGHVLGGHSLVIAPDGTVLEEGDDTEEGALVALDRACLEQVRHRFCPAGERSAGMAGKNKIVSRDQLSKHIAAIRQQGSRVAFTNGCFDLLHSGHVAYLEEARNTADCLVVGLNSDRSVRGLKGAGRPVNEEQDRARVLSALDSVDFVVIFDEETPLDLICTLLPDVLVKGADWEEHEIVGAPEVKAAGGRIVRVAFEHALSTSELIRRAQKRD
jgi:rfaE bifunctional protein nucleotidyltransferase chain/domain